MLVIQLNPLQTLAKMQTKFHSADNLKEAIKDPAVANQPHDEGPRRPIEFSLEGSSEKLSI